MRKPLKLLVIIIHIYYSCLDLLILPPWPSVIGFHGDVTLVAAICIANNIISFTIKCPRQLRKLRKVYQMYGLFQLTASTGGRT